MFVAAKRAQGSPAPDVRIRLGDMTVDEFHRRYMGRTQ